MLSSLVRTRATPPPPGREGRNAGSVRCLFRWPRGAVITRKKTCTIRRCRNLNSLRLPRGGRKRSAGRRNRKSRSGGKSEKNHTRSIPKRVTDGFHIKGPATKRSNSDTTAYSQPSAHTRLPASN
ncbi:hypothetical protein BO99DRAFT_224825 [Aspergillus violaceofuscus CBS 115571]|uniref:Uncharacterized protein n=1 Tax=Aspergillus violaceofuscus (strain CBS 115571) TaxID=1450538 RepID=A0A2V5ITD8_ASPV1|nr:hypothetical protein BO99DRAFT_224825 [Aspergillus violaceofuscus CBS 115571]